MFAMRSLPVLAVVALLLAPFAIAQDAHEHHHMAISLETPVPNDVTPTGVTRTFTITARQFAYTISPLPFKANVGDTVVINATSSDVRHGLLMERYVLHALVLDKGKTSTTTFVADQDGTFIFLCDQASCGVGHSQMEGNFVVETATLPAPTITGFQPTTGSTAGGTAVTITGTNFQSGAAVKFGSTSASSVNVQSPTSIIATAPAQAAGASTITVTNPDNQSATANGFTYVVPPPSISGVSPATGPSNGGTVVTISGANFQSGAAVTFGGVAAQSVNVTGSGTIVAITPPGPASEEQGVALDVKVTNPDGLSVTQTQAFRYTSAPLSISIVSPASGPNTGGTLVSISGSGFTSALANATVKFGGVAGTELHVSDAATLTVKTPAHANGTVDVAITMGNQTITALAAFTYEDSPARRRPGKR